MVQELAASIMEEMKPSFLHGGLLSDAPSPFFSSTSSNFATASFSTTLPPSAPEPPLLCPRCDSPNTKFCYYNNYNLTQPRHFCKTCRRYWTKGGALRNIPIGGGCRKARLGPANPSPATGGKPGTGGSKANKFTPSLDTISLTRLGFEPDPELFPRPILWAASPPPPASQLLALLGVSRVDGFQTNATIKEEAISGGQGLGLDPLGQFVGSPWRNEGQIQFAQQQQNDLPLELYQRLRPPPAETAYSSDQWIWSNGWSEPVCSSATTLKAGNGSGGGGDGGSATAAALHEPVLGAEFGYWNPILSWSDTPSTTN